VKDVLAGRGRLSFQYHTSIFATLINTDMFANSEHIKKNLDNINQRISAAQKRSEHTLPGVRLIAVTKEVSIEEIRILRNLGVTHFAENRIEIAADKIQTLNDTSVVWHMIGPLQRRKIRKAISLFKRIDSIERYKAAESLQRQCDEADISIDILLELNISGESTKQGFTPVELDTIFNDIRKLDRLKVCGLMTMAPYGAEQIVLRQVFSELRICADDLGLPIRSMGMTDDFEIAIEEGATEVRIGRALYA